MDSRVEPGYEDRPRLVLSFPSDEAELVRARERACVFLLECGTHERTIHAVDLVFEKLVGNIVRHGFGGRPDGRLEVRLETRPDALRVVLVDDGPAFDPTTHPPPKRPRSIEEAEIGGLGISMVRAVSEGLTYRREGERNVLEIDLDVPPE